MPILLARGDRVVAAFFEGLDVGDGEGFHESARGILFGLNLSSFTSRSRIALGKVFSSLTFSFNDGRGRSFSRFVGSILALGSGLSGGQIGRSDSLKSHSSSSMLGGFSVASFLPSVCQ